MTNRLVKNIRIWNKIFKTSAVITRCIIYLFFSDFSMVTKSVRSFYLALENMYCKYL